MNKQIELHNALQLIQQHILQGSSQQPEAVSTASPISPSMAKMLADRRKILFTKKTTQQ